MSKKIDPNGFAHINFKQLLAFKDVVLNSRKLLQMNIFQGEHDDGPFDSYRFGNDSFDGISEYIPGFDMRRLDWRSSLRLKKLFVRRYNCETNNEIKILLNQSFNMYFGSRYKFKSVIAAEVAATLAWIQILLQGKLEFFLFNDDRFFCSKQYFNTLNINKLFSLICEYNHALHIDFNFSGKKNYLNRLLLRLQNTKKETIIIISDFHMFTDKTLEYLTSLAQSNKIIFFHVFDPIIFNLSETIDVIVSDSAEQFRLNLISNKNIELLKNRFSDVINEYYDFLQGMGVLIIPISSGKPCIDQLHGNKDLYKE